MTKKELIERVQKTVGVDRVTKTLVDQVINTTFDTISTVVKKEGKLTYAGFGTWTLKKRRARKGRNPQTGESIRIKASKTVYFRPSKNLKGRL